jgi:hypothetical protein
VVPKKERIALDLHREAKTPDRTETARVDAILSHGPWTGSWITGPCSGTTPLSVKIAAVRASDRCDTDPLPVL